MPVAGSGKSIPSNKSPPPSKGKGVGKSGLVKTGKKDLPTGGDKSAKTTPPLPKRTYTLSSAYPAEKIKDADKLSTNVKWEPYSGSSTHCHPFSHTARELATLEVLLAAAPHVDLVIDLFGHRRSLQIIANNGIMGISKRANKPNAAKLLQFCTIGSSLTGSDKNKRTKAHVSSFGNFKQRALMMVDVYQVSPAKFIDHMLDQKCERGYVVRQFFNGKAGVHFNGECPWRYTGENLFQVVGETGAKPVHTKAIDKEWEKSIVVYEGKTYFIETIKRVADYEIMLVSEVMFDFLQGYNLRTKARPKTVETVTYETGLGIMKTSVVFSACSRLKGLYRHKLGTGWNKTTMVTYLRDSYNKDGLYSQLLKVYDTSELEEIVTNSVDYIIFDSEHMLTRARYCLEEYLEMIQTKIQAFLMFVNGVFDWRFEIPVGYNLTDYIKNKLQSKTRSAWDSISYLGERFLNMFTPHEERELLLPLKLKSGKFRTLNSLIVTRDLLGDNIEHTAEPALHIAARPQADIENTSLISNEDILAYRLKANEIGGEEADITEGTYYYSGVLSALQPAGSFCRALNKVYPKDPIRNCKHREKGEYKPVLEKNCMLGLGGQCSYRTAWSKLDTVADAFYGEARLDDSPAFVETTDSEWVAGADTAAKKRAYKKVVDEVQIDLSDTKWKVSAMLKSDEAGKMLITRSSDGSSVTAGRFIANVNKSVTYRFKEFSCMYKAWADIVSTRELLIKNEFQTWTVTLRFCAGKSPNALAYERSEVDHLPPLSIRILDCGDDGVIWIVDFHGGIHPIPFDLKSCDASLGVHALNSFLRSAQARGAPSEFVPFMHTFYDETRTVYKKKADDKSVVQVRVNLPQIVMVYSGAGTTSLQGAVAAGEGTLYGAYSYFSKNKDLSKLSAKEIARNFCDSLKATFGTLGMTLVSQVPENPMTVSFLKCWWVKNTAGGYNFLPMFGRRLKMGTCRTNPQSVTKSKDFDHAISCKLFQESQAGRSIPRNYPIVGDYLRYCDEFGVYTPRPGAPLQSRIDWGGTEMPDVDLDELAKQTYDLYGKTLNDLREPFLRFKHRGKAYVEYGNPSVPLLYAALYE